MVCDKWKNDFTVFEEWALSNGYADNLTIDRIDVNGNYEPNNCRWVDRRTQNNNTRSNRFIIVNGESHTLAEWGRIKGLKYCTIFARLCRGWKPDEAINGKGVKYE